MWMFENFWVFSEYKSKGYNICSKGQFKVESATEDLENTRV